MNLPEQQHTEVFPPASTARGLWWGAGVWLLLSAVAVAVRGVRWDEALEHAQILLRVIPYPSGHPQFVFFRDSFSGQTYLSALLYWLIPNDTLLCGLRNTLFLAAGVVPIYLLAARGSRSVLVGFAAGALILLEVTYQFACNYPVLVWPIYYGYGAIGTGYALLTLYLLLARNLRAAGLLLGLMPAVHLGQLPPLLAFAAVYLVWLWRKRDSAAVLRIAQWVLVGAALCAAFAVVKGAFHVAPPETGAYAAHGDAQSLWRSFVFHWDRHRALPVGEGHVALMAKVLLLIGFVLRFGRTSDRVPLFWTSLYGTIVAAIVWGTMAIQYTLGESTPFWLISWMPYRLMNHVPPLLVATLAVMLSGAQALDRDRRNLGRACLAVLLAIGLLRPVWRLVLGAELYNRYPEPGGYLLYMLFGAAVVLYLRDWRRGGLRRLTWVLTLVCALAALWWYRQFGFACVMAGGVIALALWAVSPLGVLRPLWNEWKAALGWTRNAWGFPKAMHVPVRVSLAVITAGVIALVFCEQWERRSSLPRSGFDHSVTAYLREHGDPNALIAAPPEEIALQARTGHAVLAEPAMPVSIINYMPSLGPAVAKIYADLYGMRFNQPQQPPDENSALTWKRVWPQRTTEAWQHLRKTYNLRYVISSPDVPLHLPAVVHSTSGVLYAIPG